METITCRDVQRALSELLHQHDIMGRINVLPSSILCGESRTLYLHKFSSLSSCIASSRSLSSCALRWAASSSARLSRSRCPLSGSGVLTFCGGVGTRVYVYDGLCSGAGAGALDASRSAPGGSGRGVWYRVCRYGSAPRRSSNEAEGYCEYCEPGIPWW